MFFFSLIDNVKTIGKCDEHYLAESRCVVEPKSKLMILFIEKKKLDTTFRDESKGGNGVLLYSMYSLYSGGLPVLPLYSLYSGSTESTVGVRKESVHTVVTVALNFLISPLHLVRVKKQIINYSEPNGINSDYKLIEFFHATLV